MPAPADHVARALRAVVRDVAVTLGWSTDRAQSFVAAHVSVDAYADHADDGITFAAHLIRDTQLAIQEERIDTTWPACPMHHRHPLTIDYDLTWRCPAEDVNSPDGFVGHVPLGWLDMVWRDEAT